jgi:hypothetical protein
MASSSPIHAPKSVHGTKHSHAAPKALREYAFDIDENILSLPSRVKMLDTETKKMVYMESEVFALKRTDARYQEVPDSMAEFRDDPTGKHNFFKEAIEKAIASGDFKGRDWNTFVRVMNDKELAATATFPSARGHSRKAMMEGFKLLQTLGYIKYLPKEENLFPVSWEPLAKQFEGSMRSPSVAKGLVIRGLLDKLQEKSLSVPKGLRERTQWSFSDDDFHNYDTVRKLVSEKMERWPNIEIVLSYTGAKPEKTVLRGTESAKANAPARKSA